MAAALRYFRARHVAPMTGPVIDDGCVVIDGETIVAVGRTADLKPPTVDHDSDGLLTPGLINAHTHLELTNVRRPPAAGTLPEWLFELMTALRSADAGAFDVQRAAAVADGLAQCHRFGVTCVGDITQNVDVVRPLLAAGPTRAVSFGECLGLGERRGRFDTLLAKASEVPSPAGRVAVGVSPHAPYTVDAAGYAAAWAAGRQLNGVTTHLAETADEADFLADAGGGFGGLYARLGRTDLGPARGFAGSPIAWLDTIVRPGPGDVLAHVNFCTDDDLAILRRWNAAVAWCPRTHAYFGHPPHRWQDMRAAGINVCLGTDSCASSPDLNLMDDLRLVRRQSPGVTVDKLWTLVTSSAADALRWRGGEGNGLGRLYGGAAADLVEWPTRSNNPLAEVLDTQEMLPTRTWVGGDLVSSPGTPGAG